MDANFMNAKEMKYNVRKKENNIHLERETKRRSKNYIQFYFFSIPTKHLLLFTRTRSPRTPTHRQITTAHLHNIHSLLMFGARLLFRCFCCVWHKILDMLRRGARGETIMPTAKLKSNEIRNALCCNATVPRAKFVNQSSDEKEKTRQRISVRMDGIDNGTMCTVIGSRLPHPSVLQFAIHLKVWL